MRNLLLKWADACDKIRSGKLEFEQGQFFFRKIGYRDCGSLLMPDEPLEIILSKNLG